MTGGIYLNVYLDRITGIEAALDSLFMSKRTWTPELHSEIMEACAKNTDRFGRYCPSRNSDSRDFFDKQVDLLFKWGKRHYTMLRFIDFSCVVEGIHRGAQDDFDSHAKRLDNRIIRSSTRLADFGNEMSDYYKDKIITTDEALKTIEFKAPDLIVVDGKRYVKCVNGYILEEYKDDKDVKRGLYMLSIPSNFVFKCQLTEWAHIYKERNEMSNAAPELKEMVERVTENLHDMFPWITKQILLDIKN